MQPQNPTNEPNFATSISTSGQEPPAPAPQQYFRWTNFGKSIIAPGHEPYHEPKGPNTNTPGAIRGAYHKKPSQQIPPLTTQAI